MKLKVWSRKPDSSEYEQQDVDGFLHGPAVGEWVHVPGAHYWTLVELLVWTPGEENDGEIYGVHFEEQVARKYAVSVAAKTVAAVAASDI